MSGKKPKVTEKPVKLLAGEELKAVTGGMLATFQYGNTAWLIWASAKDHTVIQVTAEPA